MTALVSAGYNPDEPEEPERKVLVVMCKSSVPQELIELINRSETEPPLVAVADYEEAKLDALQLPSLKGTFKPHQMHQTRPKGKDRVKNHQRRKFYARKR